MIKKAISVLCLSVVFTFGYSQDKEKEKINVVANGSFEEFEGDLRRDEEFGLTKGWSNASGQASELYNANVRSRYVLVPDNIYGSQEAYDGNGYAGLNMYSYRNENPRSYITTKLSKTLKANGLYCVKFRVSLAERSRYAVNNIGAVLSEKDLTSKGNTSLQNNSVLHNTKNEIIADRDGWATFCKLYNATGKERYLTIGNFDPDSRTKTQTMETPEAYAEKGAENMAYYYIDGVEVLEISYADECNCSTGGIPESKVIYSAAPELKDEMTVTEKIEAVDIYFYQYKSDLTPAAKKAADMVVEIMKKSPMMKVQIVGHSDNEEVELAKTESSISKLARDRAVNVMAYMQEQGIDRTRLSIFSEDNKKPVSTMATPISLAKNRRVEFVLDL